MERLFLWAKIAPVVSLAKFTLIDFVRTMWASDVTHHIYKYWLNSLILLLWFYTTPNTVSMQPALEKKFLGLVKVCTFLYFISLTSRGTVTPAAAIKSKRSLSMALRRSSTVLTLSSYKQWTRTTKDNGNFVKRWKVVTTFTTLGVIYPKYTGSMNCQWFGYTPLLNYAHTRIHTWSS